MTERTGGDPRLQDPAARVIPFPTAPAPPQIAFDRTELRILFNLYGRMVSQGEWRDYASISGAIRRCSRSIDEVPRCRSTGSRRTRSWLVARAPTR